MASEDQEKSPSGREERRNGSPDFGTAQAALSSAHQGDSGRTAEINEDQASLRSEVLNPTEAGNAADGTLSLIAAAIGANRIGFLQALYSTVGSKMPLTARRELFLRESSIEDEAAVFDLIAAIAVEEAEETVAATICAALAARTIVRSLQNNGDDQAIADGETLISAWIETARSLAAARGALAMRRLLSTAALLAQRAAERRESVAEIAAIVRRLAMRVAADSSLERAFGGRIETQNPDQTSRAAWARRAESSSVARLT